MLLQAKTMMARRGVVGTSSVATLQFTDSDSSTAALTTYTFSGVDLGALGDKLVIVAVGWGAGTTRTISSATIAGVAATVLSPSNSTDTGRGVGVVYAPLPDATGDVVITMSGGAQKMDIGVYAARNLASNTPVSTDTAKISPAATSTTLSLAAGALSVAAYASAFAAAVTWSGIDAVGDINTQPAGVGRMSAAHGVASLTATTAGNTTRLMVGACWL